MMGEEQIGIGLLGIGVIGGGVARNLQDREETYAQQTGLRLRLLRVLERDRWKAEGAGVDPAIVSDDPAAVLGDKTIDIVIELLGGEHPAYDFIKEALLRGPLRRHRQQGGHGQARPRAAGAGPRARRRHPVRGQRRRRHPDHRAAASATCCANEITAIRAIINGTTNYILTRMSREGIDFERGAAPGPGAGLRRGRPHQRRRGHRRHLQAGHPGQPGLPHRRPPRRRSTARASPASAPATSATPRELGYAIKLLALARKDEDGVEVRVHPALVPRDELLAKVDGVLNAVQVEGDLVGRVLFQGPGAGPLPTSSAIVADVLDAAQSIAAARAGRGPDRSPAAEPAPACEADGRAPHPLLPAHEGGRPARRAGPDRRTSSATTRSASPPSSRRRRTRRPRRRRW